MVNLLYRLLRLFLTFIFIVSCLFLLPNPSVEAKNLPTNERSSSKPTQPINVNMYLWADQPGKFTAELAVPKKAIGKWTYFFNGKQIGSKKGTQSIKFQSPLYDVNAPHKVKVTFEGEMVGGSKIVSNQEIHLPKISYHYQQSKEQKYFFIRKKEVFSIKMSQISRASGRWAIMIKDEDGTLIKLCDTIFSEAFTYRCSVDALDEGKYSITFFFIGTFDKMFHFANYAFWQESELAISDDDLPGTFKLKSKAPPKDSRELTQMIHTAQTEQMETWKNHLFLSLAIFFIVLIPCLVLFRSYLNKMALVVIGRIFKWTAK